jgi:hypothetical protein
MSQMRHTQPDETHTEPDETNTEPDETHTEPDETHTEPDETHTEPHQVHRNHHRDPARLLPQAPPQVLSCPSRPQRPRCNITSAASHPRSWGGGGLEAGGWEAGKQWIDAAPADFRPKVTSVDHVAVRASLGSGAPPPVEGAGGAEGGHCSVRRTLTPPS